MPRGELVAVCERPLPHQILLAAYPDQIRQLHELFAIAVVHQRGAVDATAATVERNHRSPRVDGMEP
jgi:hypothetical protein